MRSRYSAEDIISAYRETGSVWRAGKKLGIAGQTVHERLRAIDYPLGTRVWTDEEVEELRGMVGRMPLGEIANRLGRPYAGVACKVSDLGIGTRYGNKQQVKIPRGVGFDKVSVKRYAREITSSGEPVSRYARRNGLGVEMLCQALERHVPDWWEQYRREHSDLPQAQCGYCERQFVPSTKKQVYCSRKCGTDARKDESYFGGRRRHTIGMAEGMCQLCGRTGIKGLSSHHVIGKQNDPENLHLIALCRGCHQVVTLLGGREFVDRAEGWEALVQLVLLRRHGADGSRAGVECFVDIDYLSTDDVDDLDALLSRHGVGA